MAEKHQAEFSVPAYAVTEGKPGKKRKTVTIQEKARNKNILDKQRNKTRVNIGVAFQRWRELRELKGLKSDSLMALFLLDSYEKDISTSTPLKSGFTMPPPPVSTIVSESLSDRCSNLTHLTVCFCENLTDNGFECLDKCASLVSLDITGCKIHDKGLAVLGANNSLRKLTATECVFITDKGIKMFCRQCHRLELLDVCHSVCLSDHSIKALSFFCRTIATVRIAGCPKMTDTAVKYLTRAGHFLRELDVSGCPLLTDRTPSLLLCCCPQLRSISMLYCKNISSQAALKLQRRVQHWKHSNDDAPYSLD